MENIFLSRNYRLNRLFMQQIGVWPEQNPIVRIVVPSFVNIFLLSAIISGVLRVVSVRDDFDKIMETLPNIVLYSGSVFMLINTSVKTKLALELLRRIEYTWKTVANKPLLAAILESYASAGRKFTILHGVFLWSNTAAYSGLPLIPVLLDIVVPLNESRPKKFLFRVDYGIDEDKHYYGILFHAYLVTFISISIVFIVDTTYSTWVQHCCALFKMTGYSLKNAEKISDVDSSYANSTSKYCNTSHYKNLCLCVRQHKDAIEFADLLESTYSLLNAYIVGATMFLMSASAVILVTKANNIDEAIRFFAMMITLTYHLFHTTFFGQKLIDHSSRISEYAYDSDWTIFSPETQKLLILIMRQAQRPCFLTAGKVYVINMENFSAVVKTSISYFTMLSSLR